MAPADLPSNICFIGISFHHLKRREGDVVYASVAQAFCNEIEPFALKGSLVPHDQSRDREPYLTDAQAESLMTDVLDKHQALAGILPTRVVVHKTSIYQPEEEQGFRTAAEARVPCASEANAPATGGGREMVEERGARLLQLSCRSRQSRQSQEFSFRGTQALAACDSTPQSAEREHVGALRAFCSSLAPHAHDSSSLSSPCGGRRVTGVPTATPWCFQDH